MTKTAVVAFVILAIALALVLVFPRKKARPTRE
jgi:hypothetical protein